MVTVIWETWLKPGYEDEGLMLTRRIWADMTSFHGYRSHQLLLDDDMAGHLLVVSEWINREAADRIRDEYSTAEPVRRLAPLLAKPRGRWVLSRDYGERQGGPDGHCG